MKHCYIKDIESILHRSFTNKVKEKVMTKNILNHCAVDHITAPHGTFTHPLVQILTKYLKEEDDWTSEQKLILLATNKERCSYSETTDALLAIQEKTCPQNRCIDIGDRWTQKLGREYIWYDMTKEEIEQKEEALAEFEAL